MSNERGGRNISEEEDESGSAQNLNWVQWYCRFYGNNMLCEVDRPFIEDTFNLFGIKQFIPELFHDALDVILDKLGKINGYNVFYHIH